MEYNNIINLKRIERERKKGGDIDQSTNLINSVVWKCKKSVSKILIIQKYERI